MPILVTTNERETMVEWKSYRRKAGLTQIQVMGFMRDAGFSWHQTTVYNIETGKREVEFLEGLILCRILDIRIQDIKLPVNDSYVVI